MPDAASDVLHKLAQLRARHILFLLLALVGIAFISAPELWAPWVCFTGGSFHARPSWSGVGSFAGPDGTYQLYFSLGPLNTGAHNTFYTALEGDGHLCTPTGERLVIHVEGDMDKHLPMDTRGQWINISSFTRGRPGSFAGMKAPGSPYVKLAGVWGTGKIEAKGTLEHEPAAHGHPPPPKAAPIAVTLQQACGWWPPKCQVR